MLSRIWYSKTPMGLLQSLKNFQQFDNQGAWRSYTPTDARDYVKACLMSNAVGLRETRLLPDDWFEEELVAAGVVSWDIDISWMRRDRWANLDRLAQLEARA